MYFIYVFVFVFSICQKALFIQLEIKQYIRYSAIFDGPMRFRFSFTPSRYGDKIETNDESRGRLKGLWTGWRRESVLAFRAHVDRRNFLVFLLILFFFVGHVHSPLVPTYRRSGRQSIIHRRSSRDSTAGRKLSGSLICRSLSSPLVPLSIEG